MAAYGEEAGATAYWTAAGYEVPDEGDIAAALVRGSDFIDAVYGSRFTGVPTNGIEQARAWPRTGAVAFGSSLATDLIPTRVVNAAYEAALLELREPGSLSTVTNPYGQVKRSKVDVVEEEFFSPKDLGSVADGVVTQSFHPIIHGLLLPLLTPDPTRAGFNLLAVGR